MLALDECEGIREAGPKARRLAAARRRGLRVPGGLVLLPRAPLPTAAELDRALAELSAAPLFAVRSSAAVEDLVGRSAAGLFTSCTDVARAAVGAAIETVRASGDSAAVRGYCGAAVDVAVLIQPMVAAARLGVLYLRPDGSMVCEERPAGTGEWGDVTPRLLGDRDSADASDTALTAGARQLGELLQAEDPRLTAAFIEYAIEPSGAVSFLQVRPAPPPPDPAPWIDAPPADPTAPQPTFVLDREHNPDPLSAAQAGIVDGVADLVPTMRQRVVRSYLYYALAPSSSPSAPAEPLLSVAELERRFAEELLPACDALLLPLEARLLAADGAIDERLLTDPALALQRVALPEAWAAYRGVYARYVGELGRALRRARSRLDELLRRALGQSLARHGALLSGIGGAQTLRLQALWELGRAGCPRPALRAHLARYGAYAPSWDVAVPCDDEQPDRVRAAALSLARSETTPLSLHTQAQRPYKEALQRLLDEKKLPPDTRAELQQLLPQVRAALRIAEDDDALFFRAQRLLRWALLGRGAALCAARRLPTAGAVFDLPWTLHGELHDRAQRFDPVSFAAAEDLSALAIRGSQTRSAARVLVPPARLCAGQPLWALPDGVLLTGCGVPVPSLPAGPLRGRARVVRSLDEPLALTVEDGDILVLPALLPSWAHELWHARALVTDSGGAFCHGAIVARERGLPAVLGTQVATRCIRDGQELWLDATAGRVLVLP